jgi:hypothetical protein
MRELNFNPTGWLKRQNPKTLSKASHILAKASVRHIKAEALKTQEGHEAQRIANEIWLTDDGAYRLLAYPDFSCLMTRQHGPDMLIHPLVFRLNRQNQRHKIWFSDASGSSQRRLMAFDKETRNTYSYARLIATDAKGPIKEIARDGREFLNTHSWVNTSWDFTQNTLPEWGWMRPKQSRTTVKSLYNRLNVVGAQLVRALNIDFIGTTKVSLRTFKKGALTELEFDPFFPTKETELLTELLTQASNHPDFRLPVVQQISHTYKLTPESIVLPEQFKTQVELSAHDIISLTKLADTLAQNHLRRTNP